MNDRRLAVVLVVGLVAASLFFSVTTNYRYVPERMADGRVKSLWTRSLEHWHEQGFLRSCGLIYFSPAVYRGIPGWKADRSNDVVYQNAGPAFLLLQYPLQEIHRALTGHFSGVLLAANALAFVIVGALFLGLLAFRILLANGFSVRAATLMAVAAALIYQNFGPNLAVVWDFHPPTAGASFLIVVTYLLYRHATATDPSAKRKLNRLAALAFLVWGLVDFVVMPIFFLLVWALALHLRGDSWREVWLRSGLLPTLVAIGLLLGQLACGIVVAKAEFVGSSFLFRTGLDGNRYTGTHAAIWPLFFAPGAFRWWLALFPFAIPFYGLLLVYRCWWVPRREARAPALGLEVDLVSKLIALYVVYFAVFSQHVMMHTGFGFSSHVFRIHPFIPSVLIVCAVFPGLLKRVGVSANAIAYAWTIGGVVYVWASWRLYAIGGW